MALKITYPSSSPWSNTPINGRFLDRLVYRPIQPQSGDEFFVINSQKYVHRPDNFAYDYYGDEAYWWVFGVRNGWEDLCFDMKLGTPLFVPARDYILRLS